MGFRAIERWKGVPHTTIINWVKSTGKLLPNAYESQFLKWQSWMNEKLLWAQKNKVWLWTAVDHLRTGILGWVIGEWLTPRYANG